MIFGNFDDVLDDLYIRFILGLPNEEKDAFERLGFHIELAYWFYEDFVHPTNPSTLPKYTFKTFGILLMQKFRKLLPRFSNQNLDELFSTFSAYKSKIPTYGAILINETCTKILLVRGWSSKLWGFPKGKVTKNESPHECAIREVYEEIGFNISDLIDETLYVDGRIFGNTSRMFLIKGVPETTPFAPIARKEIAGVCWISIESLKTLVYSSQFRLIRPFYKPLLDTITKYGTVVKKIERGQLAEILRAIHQFFNEYPLPFEQDNAL